MLYVGSSGTHLGRIFIYIISSVKITCFTSFVFTSLRINAPANTVIWSRGAKCVSIYWIHHSCNVTFTTLYQRDERGEASYDLSLCVILPPLIAHHGWCFLLIIRDVFTEHKTTFCQLIQTKTKLFLVYFLFGNKC